MDAGRQFMPVRVFAASADMGMQDIQAARRLDFLVERSKAAFCSKRWWSKYEPV